MDWDERNKQLKSLTEKYGYIGPEHEDRMHLEGFRTSSGPDVGVDRLGCGTLCIVICLDPASPLGQNLSTRYFIPFVPFPAFNLGRVSLPRYFIPFVPTPDFHLERASLWIYPVGEEHVRMEVRVPELQHVGGDVSDALECIYGVQVRLEECRYLEPLEAVEA